MIQRTAALILSATETKQEAAEQTEAKPATEGADSTSNGTDAALAEVA